MTDDRRRDPTSRCCTCGALLPAGTSYCECGDPELDRRIAEHLTVTLDLIDRAFTKGVER
jgi:hypothetical protein